MRSLEDLGTPPGFDAEARPAELPTDPFADYLNAKVELADEALEERELPAEQPGWTPLVEIAARNGVLDRDLLKLDKFVRLVILENKPGNQAARLCGWRAQRAMTIMQSVAYHEMRAELLARHTRTHDDIHNEIFNVVADTALKGAIRQNVTVSQNPDDELANDIANKAMDRIGAKAPERSQVTHEVELSEATVALIAKAFDAVKSLNAIDLERDFGFALQRPEMDDERAMKKIGTASQNPAEVKP